MNRSNPTAQDGAAADAQADELARVEEAFNQAMVSNDITRIGECMADDWVLVTPEAGVVARSRILGVIESGMLAHDTMTKEMVRVKVYGDVAVVTARGRNTGRFRSQSISADEWVTDVYRRIDGRWLCVLTHLTPVATSSL